MKVQYPASLNTFRTKFWRYTVKDLARISIPSLLGWATLGIPGLAIGATAGLGLAEIKPQGKNLDQLGVTYLLHKLDGTQLGTTVKCFDKTAVFLNGTILGVVKVDSVDLDMASDTQWRMNQAILAELYREADYPINIHSRKRTISLSKYQAAPDQAVTTEHYIFIKEHYQPNSLIPGKEHGSPPLRDLLHTVEDRCEQVRNTLTAGDLHAHHLTGDQLIEVLDTFQYPAGEIESKRFKLGAKPDQYHRLLYLDNYPEKLEPGLLSDLLNTETTSLVEIVQDIEPITEKQRKKLGRLHGRLQVEHAATPNLIRQSNLERMVRDTQDIIEITATGEEQLVNHAVYIIIRGKSWEQVDKTVHEITRVLRRKQIKYREPWFETHQAVRTSVPFFKHGLHKPVLMPSQSAAGSFAFSTHDKIEDNGIVVGTDTRNELPVILNRFSWEAGDIARMGKKGSGKSFSVKTTILRSLNQYENLQVYILDPKKEYGFIEDTSTTDTVILDHTDLPNVQTSSDVVRYTVEDRSRDNTNRLVEAINHIYREVSKNTEKNIVVIDEAWHLLEDPVGLKTLGKLVREARDVNASIEIITQNASDFTDTSQGRKILMNLNGFIFFKHQDVNSSVTNFFNLTPKEALELKKLKTGNDLPFSEAIIRGPVNTKLRIESTQAEHEAIEGGDSE